MTIEFDENLKGVWFCSLVPDEQDFLLALSRIDEKSLEITYRFRYYNSADPFDEEDEKSWYSLKTADKSEEEIVDMIRNAVMPAITAKSNDTCFTEILRGDRSLDEFMDEFLKQDFVHTQKCH